MTDIELANSHLQMRLKGGHCVEDLTDLQTGKSWIWRGRSLSIGVPLENEWSGGWDEVFSYTPVNAFEPEELTPESWRVLESSSLGVKLSARGKSFPVTLEKTIFLKEDEPEFSVYYLLKNHAETPLAYNLKLRVAIRCEMGDELLPSEITSPTGEVTTSKSACGIRNTRTHSEFRIGFQKADFPCLGAHYWECPDRQSNILTLEIHTDRTTERIQDGTEPMLGVTSAVLDGNSIHELMLTTNVVGGSLLL